MKNYTVVNYSDEELAKLNKLQAENKVKIICLNKVYGHFTTIVFKKLN